MQRPELQLGTVVTLGRGKIQYRVAGFGEDAMGGKYVSLTAIDPNASVRWRYRDIYLNGKMPIKLVNLR